MAAEQSRMTADPNRVSAMVAEHDVERVWLAYSDGARGIGVVLERDDDLTTIDCGIEALRFRGDGTCIESDTIRAVWGEPVELSDIPE